VSILSSNDPITPTQSLYIPFRLEKSPVLLHDCRFAGADESQEDGWSCVAGEVEVRDQSGRQTFVPEKMESFYSVNIKGDGICYK
jgi:hypothetical protein